MPNKDFKTVQTGPTSYRASTLYKVKASIINCETVKQSVDDFPFRGKKKRLYFGAKKKRN